MAHCQKAGSFDARTLGLSMGCDDFDEEPGLRFLEPYVVKLDDVFSTKTGFSHTLVKGFHPPDTACAKSAAATRLLACAQSCCI
jgi:hypothetical protein